ncbi:MAG: hypothetical protein WC842_02665 [Candidatus Paceibacterota bacterium]|jgi:hypothetical protein
MKDLIESFRTQLSIFYTSVPATIIEIAGIIRKANEEEKKQMLGILAEADNNRRRILALVADKTVSDLALQALTPEKNLNDQAVIDYLFSVSENPSPVLISKISEGHHKHQEKLGEILLSISKKYSDEQTFAAISRCSAQTLMKFHSVMSHCLLGRTRFVDTINKRISELSKDTTA